MAADDAQAVVVVLLTYLLGAPSPLPADHAPPHHR